MTGTVSALSCTREVGGVQRRAAVLLVSFVIGLILLAAAPVHAHAAIAQRGTATTATVAGTSITINKPSGVQVGDVLLCAIDKAGNTANDPSLAGWTLINSTPFANATGLGPRHASLLYRVADGTEGASFTFALGAGTTAAQGTIVAFSGTRPSAPFDTTSSILAAPNNSAALKANSITTTLANSAVVMFGWARGQAAWAPASWLTATSPGALTHFAGVSDASGGVAGAWALKAAAGITGDGSGSLGINERAAAVLIALAEQPTMYTLQYNAGTGGSIVGSATQSVASGSNGTSVTAAPDPNFWFYRWSDGVLTADRRELNVAANLTVSASFQRNVTATVNASNKTYDGGTAATVEVTSSVFAPGDNVYLTHASATFADKHVGNGKTVTVTGIALAGSDANKYHLVSATATGAADITKRTLSIAAKSASKVYDGNTSCIVTPTVTGLQTGDTLACDQSFVNQHVNSHAMLVIGYSNPVDGNGGNNYSLETTVAWGEITPKHVTGAFTASDKIYDDTLAATVASTSVTGKVGADDVVLTGGTATFETQHVGTGKTVTLAGASLGGTGAGDYILDSVNTTTANITPAHLDILATADTKTYDGTDLCGVTPTLEGLQGDDTGEAAQRFTDRNVGVGKTIVITGYLINDGNGGGNYVKHLVYATGTIDPRDLNLYAVHDEKVYDGTQYSGGTPFYVGLQPGDSLLMLSQYFDTKNAGPGNRTRPDALVVDGNNGDNYNITWWACDTSFITPKSVMGVYTADHKVYDATTAATLGGSTIFGALEGDSVGLTGGFGTFDDPNVGIGKVVTVTDAVLSGVDAPNYTLDGVLPAFADITPAPLIITAVHDEKIYDGGLSSSGVPTVDGLKGSDKAIVSGQFFTDRNAGTGKDLSVIGASADDGNGGKNYLISFVDDHTGVISRRDLFVTAAHDEKVYDGSDSSDKTPTVEGLQPGDGIDFAIQMFGSKNTGPGNYTWGLVFINDGRGGANYNQYGWPDYTSFITPKHVTAGILAADKVYDGTTDALLNDSWINDAIPGDEVALVTPSAAFDDRNVGSSKPVHVTDGFLAGGDAFNYILDSVGASSASITPASLSINASPDGKVYDGTASSAQVPWADGLYAPDSVTGATQEYDNKNAGNNKTLSVTGYTVNDGNNGDNYTVATFPEFNGYILPADAQVVAVHDEKVYDGDTTSDGAPYAQGLVPGDTLDSATQAFNTRVAGTGKQIDVNGWTISDGNGGMNYLVTAQSDFTGIITPKELTSTGAVLGSKIYDGYSETGGWIGSLVGIVGSDEVTYDLSHAYAAFDNRNVGTGKPVGLFGIALTGADAGNYTYTPPTGMTADIYQANLLVTAKHDERTYDGTKDSAVAPDVSGIVGTDTVTALAQAFSDKNAGIGKTLSVTAYTVNDGNDGKNYAISAVDDFTGVITAAPLTVTAVHDEKVYDGTVSSDKIPTHGTLFDGDTFTSLAQRFTDRNVGTGKTLMVSDCTVSDGNGGANYTLNCVDDTTGIITKAELTISGALGVDKQYDGTRTATVDHSGATLVGVYRAPAGGGAIAEPQTFGGDQVSLDWSAYTAEFDTRNVGTNKPITVSGVGITGAQAGNYSLQQPTGLTADITAKPLTIDAVSDFKIYDASRSSAAAPSVTGLVGDDTVTGLAQQFDTRHAGSGKTLSVSSYTVNDGNSGNNYTVTTNPYAFGGIMPKALSIMAVADEKLYDGTVSSDGVPVVTGLVGSDTVTGLAQEFDTKDVGIGKTMSVTAYTVNDGNGGGDYTPSAGIVFTGVITGRSLTVTANDQIKNAGTAFAFTGDEFTHSALVSGDSVTGVTLASAGASAAAAPGSYPIVASDAQGSGIGNYQISYVAGTLTVVQVVPSSSTGASGTIEGLSGEATLSIAPGTLPSGITTVTFDGFNYTIVPEPGFIGTVQIPIVVTQNGVSTIVYATYSYTLGTPAWAKYGPVSKTKTAITWAAADGAQQYQVFVNGTLVKTTSSLSYTYGKFLTKKDVVEVRAVAGESTSPKVRAAYTGAKGVLIQSLRFAANSKWLAPRAKSQLRSLAKWVKAHGVRSLVVIGLAEKNHEGFSTFRNWLKLNRAKQARAYLLAQFKKLHYTVSITAKASSDPGKNSAGYRSAEVRIAE